jgi:hypothetical protein
VQSKTNQPNFSYKLHVLAQPVKTSFIAPNEKNPILPPLFNKHNKNKNGTNKAITNKNKSQAKQPPPNI